MAVLLRPAAIAGGRQVWPVAEAEGEAAREAEAASQRLVEAVARGRPASSSRRGART